jgi:hypothetical protein
MATRADRFEVGDYPMVCARSGLVADKLVPVEAARRAAWPWFFLPGHLIAWLASSWRVDGDRVWGKLPFATGQVEGIRATYDRRARIVMLSGVHADSVRACKAHQRDL